MDEKTILATGGAAAGLLASKEIILKVLGPSADYIGGRLKGGVEKADVNLCRVFQKAWERLGDAAEEPGAVNPRVLKAVWDEGRFVEDELAAEYFGGLLADSRSSDGKDDRSLPFINLVRQMSTAQIRFHYLSYATLGHAAKRQEGFQRLGSCVLSVPAAEFKASFQGTTSLGEDDLLHSLHGLVRLGLAGSMSEVFRLSDPDAGHFRLEPTYSGIELLLRSHGVPTVRPTDYVENGHEFENPVLPPCENGWIVGKEEPLTRDDVRGDMDDAIKRWAETNVIPARLGR